MPYGSSALIMLAGFLELLEFLEFLASPTGLAAIFGMGLFWGCQAFLGLDSAIAAFIAGLSSFQLYQWLDQEVT